MKKQIFKITHPDEEIVNLVAKTNQKTLARWAIDCALRVLPYFEKTRTEDTRPQKAIETLETWIQTGEFHMSVIRKASLDAHAAARDIGEDSTVRSVSRAAGQAVATAHVPRHAYGSAIYAQQAIFRATHSLDAAEKERDWQYQHLLQLNGKQK